MRQVTGWCAIVALAVMLFGVGRALPVVAQEPAQVEEIAEDSGPLAAEIAQSTRPSFGDAYEPDELFDASGGNLRRYLGRHQLTDGLYKFSIDIDRVFSSQIPASGMLDQTTRDQLVEQGILPEYATLVMQVFDVDHEDPQCAEIDHLYINGEQVQASTGPVQLTSGNNTTDVLSFDVPIDMFKFATVPGTNGAKPQALNEITIDVNVLGCGIAGKAGTLWQVRVDWATLAIKAPIRPLVLVHGWTGSPEVWRDDDDMIALLDDLGIPYAEPINYADGTAPTSKWKRLLQQEVERVRTSLGVEKVNLIAHSRGGLIARLALEDVTFARSVDTLVTLGSPHHGTNYGEGALAAFSFTSGIDAYYAALEMGREYVRKYFNFACDEQKIVRQYDKVRFEQTLYTDCVPIYRKASNVRYVSIAEGDRQDAALNLIKLVDDREATYPWNNATPPFPRQANVDLVLKNKDHSELARDRESHCAALNYIFPFVANAAECRGKLLHTGMTTSDDVPTTAPALAITFAADADVYRPGAEGTLYAMLHDGTNPLPNTQMRAELIVPEGENIELTFRDDGTAGDELANDGIFAARFTAPSTIGLHGIFLSAIYGNQTTQALEVIMVAQETATYNRIVGTRVNDLNANRLYDELEITVQVRLQQASHIRVTGDIVDANGEHVARGSYSSVFRNTTPLSRGLWNIPLRFDGTDIRNRGLNGPYTLANITIYDETEATLLVHEATTTYTTTAYQATQFEGALMTFVEGSDLTTDTDSNQLYDELTITLQFNPALPGRYRWSGRLVDQLGREIGWATGSGTLDANTPLTISFTGKRIGNSDLNGPYYLRDLSITQTSGGAARIFFQDIYTTAAYQVGQFEHDPRRLYLPLLRR
jgi:pimeloyl-ACP methyl ester carboxylesterase